MGDHLSSTGASTSTDYSTGQQTAEQGLEKPSSHVDGEPANESAGEPNPSLVQRTSSRISKVLGQQSETGSFVHPLSHSKTNEDVIVTFDGPDDPYLPLNWSFSKKAVTTVLYGLSTMGILFLPCYAGEI